jgi:hypothetical protein
MERYKSHFYETVIDPDEYITNNIQPLIKRFSNIIYSSKNMWGICKKLNFLFSKFNIEFISEKTTSPTGILNASTINNKKKTIIIRLSGDLLWIRNTKDIRFFFLELKSKLSHELIHRAQFIKIQNLKLKNIELDQSDINYMKDKHEIMAYAFNTIEYFRVIGIKDEQLKKYLIEKHPLLNSCFYYKQYINNFSINDNTLKLYYKYLYMYLDNQAHIIK